MGLVLGVDLSYYLTMKTHTGLGIELHLLLTVEQCYYTVQLIKMMRGEKRWERAEGDRIKVGKQKNQCWSQSRGLSILAKRSDFRNRQLRREETLSRSNLYPLDNAIKVAN